MADKNESHLDLSNPSRVNDLNLDALTKDQVLSIPREREYLSNLRVRELRKIARDECGPGTWITHASKEELITGTVQGHPPVSAQAVDRKGEAPGPNGSSQRRAKSRISQEYAEPMSRSLLDLLVQVSEKVIESKLNDIESALNETRKEVGLDPVSLSEKEAATDPKDEIIGVLKEEAEKSEETARKLSEEIAEEQKG